MDERANGHLDISKGVNTIYLARIFNRTPEYIRQKLATCPRLKQTGRGALYDFATACQFIVPPAVSTEDFFRAAKRGDLPAALQKEAIDAQMKMVRLEQLTKDLWQTEAVLETSRQSVSCHIDKHSDLASVGGPDNRTYRKAEGSPDRNDR